MVRVEARAVKVSVRARAMVRDRARTVPVGVEARTVDQG